MRTTLNDIPRLSIITPSFNSEELIRETLDSLIVQRDPHWECIIVDDGSSDNTVTIINEYASRDPRFRFIARDRGPKGACTCRNIGVEKSRGRYLIFLDTDDLLAPHCIEQRLEIMEQHRDLDLAIFPSAIFKQRPYDVNKWWNVETDRDLLTRQLHQDAICQGTGCIWKKSSFQDVGMWNETLMIWQDIDLFLRTWIQDYRYRVCFGHEVDLHYRKHASLSGSDFFRPAKVESRCQVIRDTVNLMQRCNKNSFVRETRFLATETIVGAARSGQYDLAKDLLNFSTSNHVLTSKEQSLLRRMLPVFRTGAWQWGPLRNWIQNKLSVFHADSQLGKVNCDQPLIQTASRLQEQVQQLSIAGA
tara:strand:+ start:570 stop:1652 length:1083 start_codon:yes stop_codon:yes gene_type:complete